MVKIAALLICILTFGISSSFAEEISCRMDIDKNKISPGKQAQLEIELPASYGSLPPEIPVTNDVDIRFFKTYPKRSPDDGSSAGNTIFQYKVVPRSEGVFIIGPFAFQSGADIYRTGKLIVTVEKETQRIAQLQAPQDVDIEGHIFVMIEVPKRSVYINERVPAYLKLYTDWIDLENVSFSQKQSEYLLVKDFKDKEVEIIERNGVKFAVLKYTSSFYAATAGDYSLEPVTVSFTVSMPKNNADGSMPELLNQNASFYESFIGRSDSRKMELTSEPVNVTVMPLPDDGRPKSFRGAVGDFNFELKSDKDVMKVSDKVMLTANITGNGNYDAIGAPVLNDNTGFKLTDVKSGKTGGMTSYAMSFAAKIDEPGPLPDVVFSYFDPTQKRYVTISRSIPVKMEFPVQPVKSPSVTDQKKKAPEVRILPIKTVIDGPYSRSVQPYKSAPFWVFLIVPWIAVPVAIMRHRRSLYLEAHPRYAALLRAARNSEISIKQAEALFKSGDVEGFYLKLFGTIQEYIGQRLLMPTAGVTGRTVEEFVEPYVGRDVGSRIKRVFSECYSARYSVSGKDREAMRFILKEMQEIITVLNKKEFGGL